MPTRRIVLRDTTLREGIQIPGSRVSDEQKRRLIALLDQAGVPEIEIGLPDSVTACAVVADMIRQQGCAIRPSAIVPCYTGRWQRQVDMAADHGIDRIDVLAPMSDELLSNTAHYGMRAEEIVSKVVQVIDYAHAKLPGIGVGCMDATRAPRQRLLDITAALRDSGASRLTIYDSVGIATPTRMTQLVEQVRASSGLGVLVHCHNDYGMATANSLAAVEAGAEAIDVALNGLGGRSGNAALEEVALALHNIYDLDTGIDVSRLRGLCEFAQTITQLSTWPLKPIVGQFSFTHVPVMHIRCIAGGNPAAFEPFDPAQVGAERRYDFSLPVNYTAALEPFIERSGCQVEPEMTDELLSILRADSRREGWTEQQIIGLIRQTCDGEMGPR